MSKAPILSTNQSAEETATSVSDVFSRFKGDEYVFTVGINRFEVLAFEHLWLIALVPLFLAALITFIVLQMPPANNEMVMKWESIQYGLRWSTIWVVFPATLALLIGTLLFRRFTRNAPGVFAALADSGRLKPGKITERYNWRTFAYRMEKDLRSPWRFVFSTFLLIIFLSVSISSGVPTSVWNSLQSNGLEIHTLLPALWVFIVYVFLLFIWIQFAWMGGWLLLIVARYLRQLGSTFRLDIQPYHQDRCGGMKRVGDLCLQMVAIYSLFGILLSFWALTKVLDESLPQLTTASYIGLAILIVIAYLTFFNTIWDIHNEMAQSKAALQDEAIGKVAHVQARLRELVSRGTLNDISMSKDEPMKMLGEENLDVEIEKLERQLERLHQLYDVEYPTWPFNTKMSFAFFSTQIVPVISLISGVIQAIIKSG